MCKTFEQWFTKDEYLLIANLSTNSCQDWTWAPVRRGEHCEDGWEVDVAQEEVEREEAQGDQVLAVEKNIYCFGNYSFIWSKEEAQQGDQVLSGIWQFI